jgi:hypothetical protein
MTTPEGHTKRRLRQILAQYDGMYSYWPVPSGFGRTTVDVIGCYRGRFFIVETKAEGKKPTLKQTIELQRAEAAMGRSFVMAGPKDPAFEGLTAWLDELRNTVPNDPRISPDTVNRHTI